MPEQRLTIAVEGMTCGGCARAVAGAIRQVPGVRDARVELAENKATVEGEDFEPGQIVEAVEEAGFKARLAEE